MHKNLSLAPRFPPPKKKTHRGRGIPPPTPSPLVSNTLLNRNAPPPPYAAIIYTLGATIDGDLKGVI